MNAIAIDQFGGLDTLALRDLPVPTYGDDEVLIRVQAAGVGQWDPFEREGGYARMLGVAGQFPYVLGSEGAGVVEGVGRGVRGVGVGDRVYAIGFLNPKGGFYAEYAVVNAGLVSPVPQGLSSQQAAAMGGVGTTALRGLEEVLAVKPGQAVVVLGASGGMGHLAVQLARRMGARVLAVASGDDGVRLARAVGAEIAVDGRATPDVAEVMRTFAPGGVNAALLTAGGTIAQAIVEAMPRGGNVAFPTGMNPEPTEAAGVRLSRFNGEPDPDILSRFQRRIAEGPFTVHIARTFPLARAADAHRALEEHHLGKLVLTVP